MISKRSLFVKRRIKLSIGLTFDGSKLLRRSLSTNNTDPFQRNQGDDNSGIGGVLRRQKETFYKKMNEFNSKYEDFIGLADVQLAQSRVKEAEKVFLESRSKERNVLREMVTTREKLKSVRERLSHVNYSNPMYLQLASDQHELVNEEERIKTELEDVEEQERGSFQNLSTAMRESYEHERARVERTKNWSIIGTVVGTLMGMIGSIYVNRVRTKELLKAVQDSGSHQNLEEKMNSLLSEADEKYENIVISLKTIAGNLVEMGNALQVQNLQVMAGLIEETMSDESKLKSSQPKEQSKSSPSLQMFADELSNYNAALTLLINAVTALSNSSISPSSEGKEVRAILQEQNKTFASLKQQIDELVSAANKMKWFEINSKLNEINKKLPSITIMEGDIIAQDDNEAKIYELPPEESQSYDWTKNVKDIVIWGTVLTALYWFIKI